MSVDHTPSTSVDLDAVRARLDGTSGPEYWRGLEELAASPAFQEALHNEFPPDILDPPGSVTRRGFLNVMGASLALMGLTSGCSRQPRERIIPYVKPPEQVIPGTPLFFASAFVLGGYATGVLGVTTRLSYRR